MIGRNGETLWIFGYAKVTRQADQSLRMSGMNMDVTDWVEALAASEARFIATFEQAAVGIAHVGTDGKWLNVNRRCCEIVGYSKNELRELTFGDITHPDDLEADWALLRSLLAGKRSTYSMEKRYFAKDKRLVWVNLTVSLVRKGDQTRDYFIAVIEDISPRKRVEAERDELIQSLEARVLERTADLEQLSRTDALTGIANRRRFDEQLISEWDRCVREHQPISIVLIDIDHFKGLNDALGHWDADRSLVLLAKVLTESTRRSIDIAARYGGDEFILLLPATGPEGAMKLATQVQEGMNRYALADPGSRESGEVTVSQGVATAWPSRKGASNSLMLAADRALYRAKEAGRNRIETEGSLQESVEGV